MDQAREVGIRTTSVSEIRHSFCFPGAYGLLKETGISQSIAEVCVKLQLWLSIIKGKTMAPWECIVGD